MRLRPASAEDQAALAALHAACFGAAAWPAGEIADLLTAPGGYGVAAESAPDQPAAGFILCRAIVNEAEVLTLAVAPTHRRSGLGRALLAAAAGLAHGAGVQAMFLEVAADNDAAIALYHAVGFDRVGLRRGYYAKGRPVPIDAYVYRRALNTRSA